MIDEYQHADQNKKIEIQQQVIEAFWNTPINFEDPDIGRDIAPFIVLEDTPMSKLHFLFIMLNISQINVIKRGIITGIISKMEFVQKRKEEQKVKRKREKFIHNNYVEENAVGLLDNREADVKA